MAEFRLKHGDRTDLPSSLSEGDHFIVTTENNGADVVSPPELYIGPNGGGNPVEVSGVVKSGDTLPSSLDEGKLFVKQDDTPTPSIYIGPNGGGSPIQLTRFYSGYGSVPTSLDQNELYLFEDKRLYTNNGEVLEGSARELDYISLTFNSGVYIDFPRIPGHSLSTSSLTAGDFTKTSTGKYEYTDGAGDEADFTNGQYTFLFDQGSNNIILLNIYGDVGGAGGDPKLLVEFYDTSGSPVDPGSIINALVIIGKRGSAPFLNYV
jgi:hypothetical protein